MADQKGVTERKKLVITTIEEPKAIGDKGTLKLQFKAKDGDKELTYFTFSKSLFEIIQGGSGKPIEFDIETSSREYNGNTYTDRKATQAYADGKPVGGQSKGGFGQRQENPEQRASIEQQVAVKLVVELLIAGKLSDKSPLYDKALQWIDARLGAVAKTPVAQSPKTPQQSHQNGDSGTIASPVADKPTPITKEQEQALTQIRDSHNKGYLAGIIGKLGWKVTKMTDLTSDQAAKLIEECSPKAT